MPRAIWSGSLSFGLVNIPVKLYSATISETLDLDLLRKSDLSPIRYLRVARADGKEVPYDQIVRGYQYQKSDYVVLTEDDLAKADVKKTKSITVLDFTDEGEIDPIYYEKPYFLESEKGSEKPYALLAAALTRSKKVGIAKFVLRTREKLCVIKPDKGLLILEQIRFEREIRSTEGLNIPTEVELSEKELELALTLINQLTEKFQPAEFKDTYTEELKDIIEEKAETGAIRPRGEAPAPTEVKDLMESLKKSLEEVKENSSK